MWPHAHDPGTWECREVTQTCILSMSFLWLTPLAPVWVVVVFLQRTLSTVMCSTATLAKRHRGTSYLQGSNGHPKFLLDEMGQPWHLDWDSQPPVCSVLGYWGQPKGLAENTCLYTGRRTGLYPSQTEGGVRLKCLHSKKLPNIRAFWIRKLFCPLQSEDLEGKEAVKEPESVTQQQGHPWHVVFVSQSWLLVFFWTMVKQNP